MKKLNIERLDQTFELVEKTIKDFHNDNLKFFELTLRRASDPIIDSDDADASYLDTVRVTLAIRNDQGIISGGLCFYLPELAEVITEASLIYRVEHQLGVLGEKLLAWFYRTRLFTLSKINRGK